MKKTKEEALKTRKQIIDKAVKLFINNGFSNTTLDQIAQQTGFTRGAIYWHFKDKLDIVKELIEMQHETMTKLLEDLFNRDEPSIKKMKNIIEAIVDNFYTSKSFRNFIDLTWFKIEYTRLTNLKTTKTELTTYFIDSFKQLVEELQESGEIKKDLSAMDVAITIANLINGMYRQYFFLPDMVKTKDQALRPFVSYLNLIKA